MATLTFGPANSNDGFTPLSVAAFNDLLPARIVRELLQNSLDAAVDAGEATAQVRFQVETIRRRDLPDAKGYVDAFRKAVSYQKRTNDGALSDAAQEIVDRIQSGLDALSSDQSTLLSIVDNGIGLNISRMNKLLADGASGKSADASGSYGVGHLASMSLSDLRYALYGGLTKDGKRIACGKVLLAAHPGNKRLNDAKGYLIEGFQSGLDGNLYKFPLPQSHPQSLSKHLNAIDKEWGHGCAVLIPAFNHFGFSETPLWDIVSKVAAYNFAPAIHRKKLVITVREDGQDDQRLDNRSLPCVLEPEQERTRAARSGTLFAGLRPSGQNAYQILRTLTGSRAHRVSVKGGKAQISLLAPVPNGSPRIDLFRNGMWITDSIPGLGAVIFANHQPFHAVIQIDAKDGGALHRLIRKAEGPMHDNLSLARLSKKERDELAGYIAEIADWIKKQAPERDSETYPVDDFLVVSSGDAGSQGQNSFSFWGMPTSASRRGPAQVVIGPPDGDDIDIKQNGGGRRPRPDDPRRPPQSRPARPLPFRSAVMPDGPGKLVGSVTSGSNFAEAWATFKVDENADFTCDRVWQDEDITVKSFQIKPAPGGLTLQSEIVDAGKLVKIQGLAADTAYEVRVEYDLPSGLTDIVESPVIRLELHRPPAKTRQTRSRNNKEQSTDEDAQN